MIKNGLLIFVLSVLTSGCRPAHYTLNQLPKEQIRFGKGGGFTGMERRWILLKNGQVFEAGKSELPKIKKKTAENLFKTAENLSLAKVQFSHPGNTYSFLEIPNGNDYQRIVWGDKAFPVDSAIGQFYKRLLSSTMPKGNER